MTDNITKAFDYASGLTKLLITLSSTIIALTITFSKEILGGVNPSFQLILIVSWLLFLLSIVFGVLTIGGLTGNLDPMQPKPEQNPDGSFKEIDEIKPNLTINSDNIIKYSRRQFMTFGFALFASVIYGGLALTNPIPKEKEARTYILINKSATELDMLSVKDTLVVIKKE